MKSLNCPWLLQDSEVFFPPLHNSSATSKNGNRVLKSRKNKERNWEEETNPMRRRKWRSQRKRFQESQKKQSWKNLWPYPPNWQRKKKANNKNEMGMHRTPCLGWDTVNQRSGWRGVVCFFWSRNGVEQNRGTKKLNKVGLVVKRRWKETHTPTRI